ncbi:PorV/PorQ family protein [Daejeonella oryzae]|uniref:membrane protein n=1 Tax=Daejeonella oryzae TaxID=1122943 RepID=UPI0003FBB4C5|nr:membrane protein [Daejeonella oryzae]
MIKIFKSVLVAFILFTAISVSAQTTSSSPYSQFGLGDLKGSLLPQNRAMGGISAGYRKPGPYSNINLANPASYSAIQLTTFDIGAYTGLRQLSNSSTSENSFNASLSHITFAMPVNKKSALSFGLLPYSEAGYQYKNSGTIDTTKVDYIYGGDGGLSKAYLGYGLLLGKNLSLGFNVGYIFGNIKEIRSAEFPTEPSALNSRTQQGNNINGLSYDYGLQYIANVSKTSKLIIGYSGNAGSKLNSTSSTVATRYRKDFFLGDESPALDTTFIAEGTKRKLNPPLTHTIGFAFEKTNKLLIGADVSYARWSEYTDGGVNKGLNDTYGIALGGQYTPDISAVSNYFKLVDYRFGLKYDKTYVNIGNNDINQYGLTFGMGLPLPSNRSSFYKINFAAELGQRGTMNNSLIRERYINLSLGFTLNDQWFIKPKFD